MAERKEVEAAIYDALIDLAGYYPSQVADMLPEKLRTAGYVIVPIDEAASQ